MKPTNAAVRRLPGPAFPLCARSHTVRGQGGFSLIVSLMMLIVIIILGVSASQMAVNEERGARNERDRQIAFQAAEAALKDAEFEILSPYSPGGACAAPGQIGRGRARLGASFTCFNSTNAIGFAPSLTSPCSTSPTAGLCDYDSTAPAWSRSLNDPLRTHIDFVGDAKGTGSMSTVRYGQYTQRTYGSQATPGLSGKPLSIYPPRYIIERVPRNTSVDTPGDGSYMFRITAMGFGANINTQVILQSIVSTQD